MPVKTGICFEIPVHKLTMDRLLPLILLYILIFVLSAEGQGTNYHSRSDIEWNEFYKLQWSDFRGKPSRESIGDAGTAVQIKAQPFYVNKKIMYDVFAYFNKDKSWARDKSDALLKHEQLHFDIAEMYARKIRKKINELSSRNVNDVKTYNESITPLLNESNDADERYDLETLHGAITKRQAVWEQKIREELTSLQDFKKQKRIIKAK
jgi:hypothetical protein